jgi:hypothetical protein
MFLGTFLVFSVSLVWVLGSNQWQQADQNDPRKILAQEVVATLKAHAPWAMRNGSSPGGEEKTLGPLDHRSSAGRLSGGGPEER